jgi:hypothetical protein
MIYKFSIFKKPGSSDSTTTEPNKSKSAKSKNQSEQQVTTIDQLVGNQPIQANEIDVQVSTLADSLENVLAFINSKSGGQKGSVVLERLRTFLPPENVYDLATTNPKSTLQKLRDKQDLTVIAGGGDGTVGWYIFYQTKFYYDFNLGYDD